ncbi:MAG: BCCT family transporter, partial [Salegentibacter mishustinae]|nr:BCCT family transporter [Salegentibacter mishustinae]
MAKKVTRSDEKKSIFGLEVNGPVFFISSFFIILSIVLTLVFEKQAETVFSDIQNAVANNADWFFIMCVNIFLVFLIYLALGPFGKMRIGGLKAKPEFKTLSWFAMLFSAGMGIGLLFFSVGEPIMHFNTPP